MCRAQNIHSLYKSWDKVFINCKNHFDIEHRRSACSKTCQLKLLIRDFMTQIYQGLTYQCIIYSKRRQLMHNYCSTFSINLSEWYFVIFGIIYNDDHCRLYLQWYDIYDHTCLGRNDIASTPTTDVDKRTTIDYNNNQIHY